MLPDGLFVVCLFCEYDGPVAVNSTHDWVQYKYRINLFYHFHSIDTFTSIDFCDHNLKVSKTSWIYDRSYDMT